MEKLIETIRDHWNIECGLHWKLDVILDEDHSRNRVKNSINNLSIMRKIIFNLASLDSRFGKVPLQGKLTRYMFNLSNIEKLIFEVIPSISFSYYFLSDCHERVWQKICVNDNFPR